MSSSAVYKQLVTDAASRAVYNSVPSQTGDGGETDNLAFSPGETCAFYFQPVSKNGKCKVRKQVYPLQEGRQGGAESDLQLGVILFLSFPFATEHLGASAELGLPGFQQLHRGHS